MRGIDHRVSILRSMRLWTLLLAAPFLFFLVSSPAQVVKSPIPTSTSPEPAGTVALDPLGRDTPRGALVGFLKYVRRGDYATSARFLEAPQGKHAELENKAAELQELMDLTFTGPIDLVSDKATGDLDDGLPIDRERVGFFSENGHRVDLILTRVDTGASTAIWLISRQTVADADALYQELEPSKALKYVPEVLTTNYFLSVSAFQWIVWLASVPMAYGVSWCLLAAVRLVRRVIQRALKHSQTPLFPSLRAPFAFTIAVLFHSVIVYLLRIPLFYRLYYTRFIMSLLIGGVFWLISRVISHGFDRAVNRLGRSSERGTFLLLIGRSMKVLLAIITALLITTELGFDTKAMLTGLGIGGLAIALAGQKTLENIIGGASLLLDSVVHVGDTCRIGGQQGKVEDIGLRSLRFRMLDQTMMIVPNGVLAQVQFENLTTRKKLLISETFSVRMETRLEQLKNVLAAVQEMLDRNDQVEKKTSRVHVVRIPGASIEVELVAYVLTSDWAVFTAIRQQIWMSVLGTLEQFDVKIAGPTQLTYIETKESIGLADKQTTAEHAETIEV